MHLYHDIPLCPRNRIVFYLFNFVNFIDRNTKLSVASEKKRTPPTVSGLRIKIMKVGSKDSTSGYDGGVRNIWLEPVTKPI